MLEHKYSSGTRAREAMKGEPAHNKRLSDTTEWENEMEMAKALKWCTWWDDRNTCFVSHLLFRLFLAFSLSHHPELHLIRLHSEVSFITRTFGRLRFMSFSLLYFITVVLRCLNFHGSRWFISRPFRPRFQSVRREQNVHRSLAHTNLPSTEQPQYHIPNTLNSNGCNKYNQDIFERRNARWIFAWCKQQHSSLWSFGSNDFNIQRQNSFVYKYTISLRIIQYTSFRKQTLHIILIITMSWERSQIEWRNA